MKLKEYEGKKIFGDYGIPIPGSILCIDCPIELFADEMVLKAQVLSGGRGKAGGIVFTDKDNVNDKLDGMFGKKLNGEIVKEILVEEKLDIEKEMYLSITIDRTNKKYILVYSGYGGVDIEEVSKSEPDEVKKISFYDISEVELNEDVLDVAKKLFLIMKEKDAELVEINPLVRTGSGELVAADSKITIDDNALFRQEFEKKYSEKTELEKEAASYGLQYVELEGDIAIIGNGAGLVMSTLDVLDYYGGKAANFLDVGGGADVEKMEKSLEIVQLKNPKGILINIFGGITKCDDIARALVNKKPKIPMVVRMIGTNEEEGKRILNKAGIYSLGSMEECAKEIVKLCQS